MFKHSVFFFMNNIHKSDINHNSLCTIINVICVMQSVSVTPADIYTNVLTNVIEQSAST